MGLRIRLDQLLRAISTALDVVEGELLGASTHHSHRIAALCAAMGKRLSLNADDQFAVAACALFHDSALTQYIAEEYRGGAISLQPHCRAGQENIAMLPPFAADIAGVVLYHHEHADGSGSVREKRRRISARRGTHRHCR